MADDQNASHHNSSMPHTFFLKLKKLFSWYLINYNTFYYLFKYKKPDHIFHNYNDYWKSRIEKEFHFDGEKNFIEGPGVSGGAFEQKMLLRLSVKHKRSKILSSLIDSGATVLDIGCGRGEILKYLKKTKDIKGFGIDVSSYTIESLAREGIDVQCRDICDDDSMERINGTYD